MRVGIAKLEKGIDSNFHFSYTIWRLSLFWLLCAPLTITRFLVIMCLKGDSVYLCWCVLFDFVDEVFSDIPVARFEGCGHIQFAVLGGCQC